MGRIILISCVSKKLPHKAKARDMYISPLFKYNLKYAESFNPDKIFILSAEYGLLDLERDIEPYNKTLNTMRSGEIKSWAINVLNHLKETTDIQKDEFIFLAGEKYRKYLLPHLPNHKIPLKGLPIGKQLKYLKEKVSDE